MPILTYFHYNHHLPLTSTCCRCHFLDIFPHPCPAAFRSSSLRCIRTIQLADSIVSMPKAEHRNSPEQEAAASSRRAGRRGKRQPRNRAADAKGARDTRGDPPPPAADAA